MKSAIVLTVALVLATASVGCAWEYQGHDRDEQHRYRQQEYQNRPEENREHRRDYESHDSGRYGYHRGMHRYQWCDEQHRNCSFYWR